MQTLSQRGIDTDLCEAFIHCRPGFPISKIGQVLAITVDELKYDGWRYRWLVCFTDGAFGLIQGGYESYTGWEMDGRIEDVIIDGSVENVLKKAKLPQNVADTLAQQLIDGKTLTHQERVAKELGRPNDVDDTYGWML